MVITREVSTGAPAAQVFDFLSDFTTTNEWDPATLRTVRESGDGDVGTVYRNASRFAGRTTELTYTVTELSPPRRITLRGENRSVVAVDTIQVEPAGDRTLVRYTASFTFRGLVRFAAPLLRRSFRRLGDDAEAGLRAALNRL